MKIEQKVKIHNRFDVHIDNIETGEHRELVGYNIILDQMWTRLCGGSSYFAYIHFGTGVGTPTPERTSLFSHLGTKSAVTEEIIKALPVSSWKRKIVLNPEEYVGQEISEVGIAYGSGSTYLVTHAMLKDAEGNPISINKTATDVVTIYATVFMTFSGDILLKPASENRLVGFMFHGSFPVGPLYLQEGVRLGVGTAVSGTNITTGRPNLGQSTSVTYTADTANKKRKSNTVRFGTTEANGNARGMLLDYTFGVDLLDIDGFNGQPYANVAVGTGDSNKVRFVLPSNNIRPETLTVKVNGVATTAYTVEDAPNRILHAVLSQGQKAHAFLSRNGRYFLISGEPYYGLANHYAYELINNELVPVSFPFPSTGRINTFVSNDGNVIHVTREVAPTHWCMEKVGETWVSRPSISESYIRNFKMSGDGNTVWFGSKAVYDWDGSAWVKRADGNILASVDNLKTSLSSDGLIMFYRSSASVVQRATWNGVEWVHDTPYDAPFNVTSVYSSPNGMHCGLGKRITDVYNATIDTIEWTGTSYVLTNTETPFSLAGAASGGGDSQVAVSSDGKKAVVCGSDAIFRTQVLHKMGGVWTTTGTNVQLMQGWYIHPSDDFNYVTYGSYYDLILLWMPNNGTAVNFNVAPASDAVITADYTVDGVHKTDQYVIDASFAVQFGEGV